jgi:hypothetical protein
MFKAMFIEAIGSAYICKKKKKTFEQLSLVNRHISEKIYGHPVKKNFVQTYYKYTN